MKKSKSNYKENDGNIFLGSIYLIITSLLVVSVLYSAPVLSVISTFLGLGIYPIILFFAGLTLKNLNLYSGLSTGYAKAAQLLLTLVVCALGYSFNPTECILGGINLLQYSCSLEFLSGNKVVVALGSEASRIFLTVIGIILLPVAFNISFDKIHFVLNLLLQVFQTSVNYLGYILALIFEKIQDILYSLEQNRLRAIEQKTISRNEKNYLPESTEEEEQAESNYSWVNPIARKTKLTNEEALGDDDLDDDISNKSFTPRKKSNSYVERSEEIGKDTDSEVKNVQEANIITQKEYSPTELNDAIVSVDGLEYPDWELPSLKLLDRYENVKVDKSDVKANIDRIERTYESFNMKVEVVNAVVGATVTQYQMNIATGVSVRAISTRQPDVALALGVNGIRIEPIPGQSLIGLEVPNRTRIVVKISEIMEELRKQYKQMKLGCVLGKSIDNKPILMDLQKMPHVLVAGTTGSGKSVLTNSIIMSLLMTKSPDELKLILVDPKKVEFSDYNDIPHLLTPVIVENEKVMNAIKWAVEEMEKRYSLLSNYKVRNIEGYNEKVGFTAMPYIVIIIDEVADLMSSIGKAFEAEVLRIAQKARATGIHLVLATQRPSVDVITGVLKGNIPGRIALKVASQQDSRVIIDRNGAETLVGYGDLLFGDPGKPSPHRVQGVWVDQKEVQRVVDFIISQVPDDKLGQNYKDSIIAERVEQGNTNIQGGDANSPTDGLSEEDSTLNECLRVILQANRFSTSLLQTYLKIGFNKASRMKMELESQGYIVPSTSKVGAYELNRDKIKQKLNGGGDLETLIEADEEQQFADSQFDTEN